MRIDLHCHTKKCKKGDPDSRNVSVDKFIKTMNDNQVSIVAITNHNYFDKMQYEEFNSKAKENNIQIWPGIELDVLGDLSSGHVIVISNPQRIDKFTNFCKDINQANHDDFNITIEQLCKKLIDVDGIVTAHYRGKTHALCQEDIDKLKIGLDKKNRFYLEVSNLRSAGIYYGKNIDCIIGSDVRDWEKYDGTKLPELKMPITDFDHFCLLIRKDPHVIKTFLDGKGSRKITITPFTDCTITSQIYDDVNVIFGGKGTGKSVILKTYDSYFKVEGTKKISYYAASDNETAYKKLVELQYEEKDFAQLCVSDCNSEFNIIKSWEEPEITSISKYKLWAETKQVNKLSQMFGFKKATFSESISKSKYDNYLQDVKQIQEINMKIATITDPNLYLTTEESKEFRRLFQMMKENAKNKLLGEWIDIKALVLEKWTIDKMKSLCSAKSGSMPLPMQTGLLETFTEYSKLQSALANITKNLDTKPKRIYSKIGQIKDKGSINLVKEIHIDLNETHLQYPKDIKVGDLKSVKNLLNKIKGTLFKNEKETMNLLTELKDKLTEVNISSLRQFMGEKTFTTNDDNEEYNPSQGEKSMLLLTNSIESDSNDVYLLDEPEMSIGHQFINEVILPRIKVLAKMHKCIIICTHDANIAVRSLPLLSIYREYKGSQKYATYIGSAFIDSLVNNIDPNDSYSWVEKSMEALEGGETAFIERKEIYGE
ncbi:MAG: PHP domain-containing protein [Solobacterium sp.]|jgi:predicted ATPase|nr:PHP domain-containing protein [Solobacterium sp.]